MAVMPIVRLFFPCAHIEENAENSSITIVDPIDSIFVPDGAKGNVLLGPIFFYTQIKEGLGTFHFRIELRNDRGRRLARTKPRAVAFRRQDRNLAKELVFIFRALRLDMPGVLRFELFANELVLAMWEMPILTAGEIP
jgi:hypothetical protein